MVDVKIISKSKTQKINSGSGGIATSGNGFSASAVTEALHATKADLAVLAKEAEHASHADRATNANEATHATNADLATEATHAASAHELDVDSPTRAQFISSETDDVAEGNIQFKKQVTVTGQATLNGGVTVGSKASVDTSGKGTFSGVKSNGTIDSTGEGSFGSVESRGTVTAAGKLISALGLETSQFTKGLDGNGAGLYKLDNDRWALDVDVATIRQKISAREVEIQRLSHVGGAVILSPATAKLVEVVPTDEAGIAITDPTQAKKWACMFLAKDGEGNSITNDFKGGDLVRCQTFNLRNANGVVSNRYYWRRVVGKPFTTKDGKYHGISIEKANCDANSDEPMAGDVISVFGHWYTDDTRKNAIVISSTGTGAPEIIQYAGVSGYDNLESKIVTRLSPNGNIITGKLNYSTESGNKSVADAVKDINTTTKGLGGRLDTAESDIINLKADSTGFSAQIQSIQTQIDGPTNNDSLISKITANTTAIEATASGLSARVSSVQQTIATQDLYNDMAYALRFGGKWCSGLTLPKFEALDASRPYLYNWKGNANGYFCFDGSGTHTDSPNYGRDKFYYIPKGNGSVIISFTVCKPVGRTYVDLRFRVFGATAGSAHVYASTKVQFADNETEKRCAVRFKFDPAKASDWNRLRVDIVQECQLNIGEFTVTADPYAGAPDAPAPTPQPFNVVGVGVLGKELTSLGNRLSTAESLITADAIINTVSTSYYQKSEVDNAMAAAANTAANTAEGNAKGYTDGKISATDAKIVQARSEFNQTAESIKLGVTRAEGTDNLILHALRAPNMWNLNSNSGLSATDTKPVHVYAGDGTSASDGYDRYTHGLTQAIKSGVPVSSYMDIRNGSTSTSPIEMKEGEDITISFYFVVPANVADLLSKEPFKSGGAKLSINVAMLYKPTDATQSLSLAQKPIILASRVDINEGKPVDTKELVVVTFKAPCDCKVSFRVTTPAVHEGQTSPITWKYSHFMVSKGVGYVPYTETRQQLKSAGIDLDAEKIVLKADKVEVTNPSNGKAMAVFNTVDGTLNTSLIKADELTVSKVDARDKVNKGGLTINEGGSPSIAFYTNEQKSFGGVNDKASYRNIVMELATINIPDSISGDIVEVPVFVRGFDEAGRLKWWIRCDTGEREALVANYTLEHHSMSTLSITSASQLPFVASDPREQTLPTLGASVSLYEMHVGNTTDATDIKQYDKQYSTKGTSFANWRNNRVSGFYGKIGERDGYAYEDNGHGKTAVYKTRVSWVEVYQFGTGADLGKVVNGWTFNKELSRFFSHYIESLRPAPDGPILVP